MPWLKGGESVKRRLEERGFHSNWTERGNKTRWRRKSQQNRTEKRKGHSKMSKHNQQIQGNGQNKRGTGDTASLDFTELCIVSQLRYHQLISNTDIDKINKNHFLRTINNLVRSKQE